MDQKSPNVVADGAGDLEALRRIVFPHLALEHVRDLSIWAAHNQLDVWNHVAGEVRFEDGRLRLVKMVKYAGLLARAEASGKYSRIGKAIWDRDEEGKPIRVHVPVYRWFASEERECWASAKWASYYPGPGFWDRFDEHQLWKCAVSIGVKIAVPDLCNLQTTDEMAQLLASLPAASEVTAPKSTLREEDLPRTKKELEMWMVDYNLKDGSKRESIIVGYKKQWKCDDDYNPMFFAEVAKAIDANPGAHGAKRPEAA